MTNSASLQNDSAKMPTTQGMVPLPWEQAMNRFIFIALITATGLSPIAVSAAEVAPTTARHSAQIDTTADFQRGERSDGDRGQRNRGERGRGQARSEVRVERRQNRVEQRQAAPVQAARVTRQGNDVRVQRRDASQDGRYYDRNRDGNLDRRWDRNRDDRLDRNWDRNRDGRLDRRYDRNDDERLDRRLDRNRNGDLDRRVDRNNDNRVDRNRSGNYGQRYDGGNDNRWSTGWRNDRRYDWRGHRNQYRSYYSPGRYYSPYRGHRYSRISIGFSLGSGYYGSQYWIDDPWYYRLPSAYGSYRWVRYYDDVLLVDLRSGRVVDVIRDFFW
jgi:hypothetical protein